MNILEKIKQLSLVTIVIGFLSGILFIAFPDKCIKYISITVGVAMIALAIAGIVGYLTKKNSAFSLVGGVLLGLIGIIVCIKYEQVVSLIVAVIGLFVMSAGITNLITGFKVIKRTVVMGWVTLLMACVTIVFGFVALTNSSAVSESLVRLIGVGLIIYAVIDLIAYFEVRSLVKEVNKAVDEVIDEVSNPAEPSDNLEPPRVTEVTDFTDITEE